MPPPATKRWLTRREMSHHSQRRSRPRDNRPVDHPLYRANDHPPKNCEQDPHHTYPGLATEVDPGTGPVAKAEVCSMRSGSQSNLIELDRGSKYLSRWSILC